MCEKVGVGKMAGKKKEEEEVDLVSTHRVAETIATSEIITRCQSMKGLFSQRLSH